jgi:hypothetical protein
VRRRCRLRRRSGLGRRVRGLGGRGSRLGGGASFVDLPEQCTDRDRFAILGNDLAQRAGRRRRNFDGDLVGFKLDQRLVDRNRIAGLLEPAADGRLGDGLAERRNADFSHGFVSSGTLSSSSAKADDPVIRDGRDLVRTAPVTGCPAFAGHDDCN